MHPHILGQYLVEHCTKNLQNGKCDLCPDNTYSSEPTSETSCEPCTSCSHLNGTRRLALFIMLIIFYTGHIVVVAVLMQFSQSPSCSSSPSNVCRKSRGGRIVHRCQKHKVSMSTGSLLHQYNGNL